MGVLTVGQGVVKADFNAGAINLKFHQLRTHGQHPSCNRCLDTAVVTRIGENRFSVVVVHVLANSIADGGSEGVSGHRCTAQDWPILPPSLGPCEPLPQQKTQADTGEADVPRKNHEQRNGEPGGEAFLHRGLAAVSASLAMPAAAVHWGRFKTGTPRIR